MATPTRPATGAIITTTWGQWAHDLLVAEQAEKKQLAYVEKIDDFNVAAAGGVDVPGWEVTYTVATARRVRVELNIRAVTGGSGTNLCDFILRHSLNSGGAVNLYVWSAVASAGTIGGQTWSTRYTAQPGSHRLWIMVNPSAALNFRAHSTGPMSIGVDDLGPA